MLKKLIAAFTVMCVLISFSGCSSLLGMGTFIETSPDKYGEWEEYLDVPDFLPETLDDCTVNAYSYTLYNYLDTCYEIFLDVTVSEEQLDAILDRAKQYSEDYAEHSADYCEGYTEIVFSNVYERGDVDAQDDLEQVGWADIEKIIYNPDTRNVVYVVFHANDTGVYDVENISYFKRFSITPDKYAGEKSDS